MTRGEKDRGEFCWGNKSQLWNETELISKFSCFLASNSHLSSKTIFKMRIVSSAELLVKEGLSSILCTRTCAALRIKTGGPTRQSRAPASELNGWLWALLCHVLAMWPRASHTVSLRLYSLICDRRWWHHPAQKVVTGGGNVLRCVWCITQDGKLSANRRVRRPAGRQLGGWALTLYLPDSSRL